jgi:hypothetical protein
VADKISQSGRIGQVQPPNRPRDLKPRQQPARGSRSRSSGDRLPTDDDRGSHKVDEYA